MPKSESVPNEMRPTYDAIVALTDNVCKHHLNAEYAAMCRQLAAALARKRPSPLTHGKVEIWACAITYTIGKVNFLFDKSQTPHLRADELCRLFGVSQSSGSNKSQVIWKMFDLMQMDPRWTLPSKMDRNPLVWMLSVNGLLMDIRYAPRGAQEEAFRRGLIPYIPADAPKDDDE
ncbi:MAG: hypothetical protein HY327_05290 [Chloroflexi bacterium]|nr:hypothetical protein [Chloroflexota bacterium]